MKIKEITSFLETLAPLSLQENYDNAGLIVGSTDAEVSSVLICLDSTEVVIEEAIQKKCSLVITHHPIIFGGIKKLNGKNYVERVVIKAIQNNIAIYAAHTNLDNVHIGVNKMICEKLGLKKCKILSPKNNILRKLVTFCPVDKAEDVRHALFIAGAGNIGNYDECSFNAEGFGTFRGNENTNLYVGKKGKQHHEREFRIETIYPFHIEKQLIDALLEAHPYEEVPYDIYPLENQNTQIGAGMIGEFEKEITENAFLKKLKSTMKTKMVRHTKLLNRKVKKVAVCGGSGSFLLSDAIRSGADAFVSADFSNHVIAGA